MPWRTALIAVVCVYGVACAGVDDPAHATWCRAAMSRCRAPAERADETGMIMCGVLAQRRVAFSGGACVVLLAVMLMLVAPRGVGA